MSEPPSSPVKALSLAVPRYLHVLHAVSAVIALVVLSMTLVDLGLFSFYLAPTFALVTIILHALVLVHAFRCHPESLATRLPVIIATYALSVAWLTTVIIMSLVSWSRASKTPLFRGSKFMSDPEAASTLDDLRKHNRTLNLLQMLGASIEFAILGDVAIRSTVLRRDRRILEPDD